jgi:hypothetical protein
MVAHPHSMDSLLQVVASVVTEVSQAVVVVLAVVVVVTAVALQVVVAQVTLHLHLHHREIMAVADFLNHSAVQVELAEAQVQTVAQQDMKQVATAVAVHLAHLADHLSHMLAVAVEAFITNLREHQEAVDRVVEAQVVKQLRQQTALMV